jgi:hypothetical protein
MKAQIDMKKTKPTTKTQIEKPRPTRFDDVIKRIIRVTPLEVKISRK